jgi:WD40 repeat protein
LCERENDPLANFCAQRALSTSGEYSQTASSSLSLFQVRFSPDGSRFASFSADKTALVYEAEDGTPIGALEAVHGGGVYAGAWSPDGRRIATACGDKTVRVFDASAAAGPFPLVSSFSIGARPDDMQQSVTWPSADTIVSTSLDGSLNVFDASNVAAGPTRRVFGHREPATVLDADISTGAIFSGCAGGRVCVWTPADEARTLYNASPANGDLPSKKISGLVCSLGVLAVVSWDDKLRFGDAASATLDAAIALGSQPKGVALAPARAGAAVAVVATSAAVVVAVRGTAAPAVTLVVPWGPTCVDVSADGAFVAVGGTDKRVHFFSLSGTALDEVGVGKEAAAAISVVAFSPDGRRVAAGDAGREIRLYDTATRETLISGRWVAHTTRVTGLRWSPSGAAIASVSSDRRFVVWDPNADVPRSVVDLAHAQPFVGVTWASETELWTLGTDGVAVKRGV